MDGIQKHRSDVARLLEEISQEYEAGRQGLTGLSQGTSQHRMISRRMERVGELHAQLRSLVGNEPMALIEARLNDADTSARNGRG